jgi:probable rRNA maturation factor
MAYQIEVRVAVQGAGPYTPALVAAAEAALSIEQVRDNSELTILLTDDDSLRAMNKRYRGEDKPTDVLSFPMGDPLPGSSDLRWYLGDIAISLQTATRQAKAQNHTAESELQLLTIHGVLHLIGYDHLEPEEKDKMWVVQNRVLRHLGLEAIQPTEDEHDS